MAEPVEPFMRDTDAFAWDMERDPVLRSTIVAVALLEHAPQWDLLRSRIERLALGMPSFRQHIVPPPMGLGPPRWVFDPGFDLGYHFRRVGAAPPRTLRTVFDFAGVAAMAGFDRARPLWEFTLMEGLDEGKAALVMKMHHSLADGIGGLQIAALLFDLEHDPGMLPPLPEASPPSAHTPLGLAFDSLAYNAGRALSGLWGQAKAAVPATRRAVRHPGGAAADVWRSLRSVARMVEPVPETLSPLMVGRSLSRRHDGYQLPLDDLKRAAKAAGCKLNDAFLAGVTGGLRRYHERHGVLVEELRVLMPISIRKETDAVGGNRITLVRFKVPVGLADPRRRMARLRDLAQSWRNEPGLAVTDAIAAGLNRLPNAYVGGMLKNVDFLASNVVGFPVPAYLAGARVTEAYPFGPTIGSSLNITLMSYCESCGLGVTTDPAAVADPEAFLACLHEGFEEVLALGRT